MWFKTTISSSYEPESASPPTSIPILNHYKMAPTLEIGIDGSVSDRLVKRLTSHPSDKPYAVAISTAPVTYDRLPYIPASNSKLVDPGTARANTAPTTENPSGSDEWSRRHADKTVVEQHAAYWDRDDDGIIWPYDTYIGCRNYGWNILLSALATFIINFNLSYPTVPGILPDPFFRIWVKRLHKDKHGSDSMSYDNEGRFRPQQFEDFFAKYDRGNKGGLDAYDLLRAHKGQRLAFDFFGWSATFFECKLLSKAKARSKRC